MDALRLETLKTISPAKKEACQLFRILLFGKVGNEHAKSPEDVDAIFLEHLGSREQVSAVHNLYQRLDANDNGRVDAAEMHSFLEHMQKKFKDGLPQAPKHGSHGSDIWLSLLVSRNGDRDKVVARLCEKVESQLLGKKSSFVIEDMMRLVWPRAQLPDLKAMKAWCQEMAEESARARVESPPALSSQEFDDLCTVFKHYDTEGSGAILFEELVGRGLIYADQVETCKTEWDADGNGVLDLLEFCEMMCPAGFRASQASKNGSLKDGTRVIYDESVSSWRLHRGRGAAPVHA